MVLEACRGLEGFFEFCLVVCNQLAVGLWPTAARGSPKVVDCLADAVLILAFSASLQRSPHRPTPNPLAFIHHIA